MGNGGSGGGMPKCPVRPHLFWAVQFGVPRNLLLMLEGGRSDGCSAGPAWLTKREYAELTSFAVGSQWWTYRWGGGGVDAVYLLGCWGCCWAGPTWRLLLSSLGGGSSNLSTVAAFLRRTHATVVVRDK